MNRVCVWLSQKTVANIYSSKIQQFLGINVDKKGIFLHHVTTHITHSYLKINLRLNNALIPWENPDSSLYPQSSPSVSKSDTHIQGPSICKNVKLRDEHEGCAEAPSPALGSERYSRMMSVKTAVGMEPSKLTIKA